MKDIKTRYRMMISTTVLLLYGIIVFPIVLLGALCGLISFVLQKLTNTLFDFICDCVGRVIIEENK